jgi:hypothetical protein
MAQAPSVFLQSALGAEQCIERLRQTTDEQHRTLFSFSGYRGSKPILSRIEGYNFQLQKRRYYRNDLAPNFFGKVIPWGSGARIEGRFGPPRWSLVFLRIWLGFALLVAIPLCISAIRDILAGQRFRHGDAYAGLLIPLGLVLVGWLAPRFGDWLGRNEKTFILQFLETTLAACPEPPPPPTIG